MIHEIPESFLKKWIESALIIQNEFCIPFELRNIFTATPYDIQMIVHDRKSKVLCIQFDRCDASSNE